MNALKVSLEKKNECLVLRLDGSIGEDAFLEKIKVGNEKDIIIDVGAVESINSCGSRDWVRWIKGVNPSANIRFINCNSIFLDYVNMIEGFIPPNGSIESFNVPYYCESCISITLKMFEAKSVKANINEVHEVSACNKCGKGAEIDVVLPSFFNFLKRK